MDRLIDLDAERQRKAQELEEKFAAFRQEVERSKIASEPISEAITKLIDAGFSWSEIKALLRRAAEEIDNHTH
jgi:DNA-binding transcriptional regulator YhcF (GntR family)